MPTPDINQIGFIHGDLGMAKADVVAIIRYERPEVQSAFLESARGKLKRARTLIEELASTHSVELPTVNPSEEPPTIESLDIQVDAAIAAVAVIGADFKAKPIGPLFRDLDADSVCSLFSETVKAANIANALGFGAGHTPEPPGARGLTGIPLV